MKLLTSQSFPRRKKYAVMAEWYFRGGIFSHVAGLFQRRIGDRI